MSFSWGISIGGTDSYSLAKHLFQEMSQKFPFQELLNFHPWEYRQSLYSTLDIYILYMILTFKQDKQTK